MSKQTMKIHEALRWASSFLNDRGLEQPIAEILLKYYLSVDRTKMFAMLQEELPNHIKEKFEKAIFNVSEGVPVQYITGVEHFYGRQFIVNENVLIPRPETEELVLGLVKRINEHFTDKNEIDVVDVGTGSGAIAITLALEHSKLNVSTIDISLGAIEVAKKNARTHNAKITFLEGDLLAPMISNGLKVDVLVSNPPYISEADFAQLASNVRDYEPTLALVGGETGYELYERLIEQAPRVLKRKAIIAFEVGVGQSKYVQELLVAQFPGAITEIVNDINGKDRMVFALLKD